MDRLPAVSFAPTACVSGGALWVSAAAPTSRGLFVRAVGDPGAHVQVLPAGAWGEEGGEVVVLGHRGGSAEAIRMWRRGAAQGEAPLPREVVLGSRVRRKWGNFKDLLRAGWGGEGVLRIATGLSRRRARVFEVTLTARGGALRQRRACGVEVPPSTYRSLVAACWSTCSRGLLLLAQRNDPVDQIDAVVWDLTAPLAGGEEWITNGDVVDPEEDPTPPTTTTITTTDDEHFLARPHAPIAMVQAMSGSQLGDLVHPLVSANALRFSETELDLCIARALEYCKQVKPDVERACSMSPWREMVAARYLGEVDEDDQPHGHGSMWIESEGVVYSGQWKHGERHGHGTARHESCDVVVYQGPWRGDRKSGSGGVQVVVSLGDRDDDVLDVPGAAATTRESGDTVIVVERYEGQFENDKREGFGVLHFVTPQRARHGGGGGGDEEEEEEDDEDHHARRDGAWFEGFFKNGYQHGYGRRGSAGQDAPPHVLEEHGAGILLHTYHLDDPASAPQLEGMRDKCWRCTQRVTGPGLCCAGCGFLVHSSCFSGPCPFSSCRGGTGAGAALERVARPVPGRGLFRASATSHVPHVSALATPPRTWKETAREQARREAAKILDARRAVDAERRLSEAKERTRNELTVRRDVKRRKTTCDPQLARARVEMKWLLFGVALCEGARRKDVRLAVGYRALVRSGGGSGDEGGEGDDEHALVARERALMGMGVLDE